MAHRYTIYTIYLDRAQLIMSPCSFVQLYTGMWSFVVFSGAKSLFFFNYLSDDYTIL